jgi:hypothetical protein
MDQSSTPLLPINPERHSVNVVVVQQLLCEEGREKSLCVSFGQLKLLGLEAIVTLMMTHTSITDERYPAFGWNAAAVVAGFPAIPPPPTSSVAAIEKIGRTHESRSKKKKEK